MKIVKDLNNNLLIYNEDDKLLEPRSTDASLEKHVPVVKENNNKVIVTVGEILHPMTEEHYISHIIIETDKGYYVRLLKPNDKPEIEFNLNNEKLVSVYAHCNLHGLWR